MSDLRPCPFCGGHDIVITKHGGMHHKSPTGEVFSMCCYNCGATFPNRYVKKLLIDAWNTRTESDQIKKLTEALESMINQFGEPEGSDFLNEADYIAVSSSKKLLAKGGK